MCRQFHLCECMAYYEVAIVTNYMFLFATLYLTIIPQSCRGGITSLLA